MHASVRREFPKYLRRFEGPIPFLYVDNEKLVTAGIGLQVDKLDMLHRVFGDRSLWYPRKPGPGEQQITLSEGNFLQYLDADHAAVKRLVAGVAPYRGLEKDYKESCRQATRLRLKEVGIQKSFHVRLEKNEKKIRGSHFFREWEFFPADAQMVLLDLAWWAQDALATGGYCKSANLHPLCVACEQEDFLTAAHIVLRWVAEPPRKKARHDLFMNAALVKALNLEPSYLYYGDKKVQADKELQVELKGP